MHTIHLHRLIKTCVLRLNSIDCCDRNNNEDKISLNSVYTWAFQVNVFPNTQRYSEVFYMYLNYTKLDKGECFLNYNNKTTETEFSVHGQHYNSAHAYAFLLKRTKLYKNTS